METVRTNDVSHQHPATNLLLSPSMVNGGRPFIDVTLRQPQTLPTPGGAIRARQRMLATFQPPTRACDKKPGIVKWKSRS